MERLVRLATALHHAGDQGVPAAELATVAGFAEGADPSSQLSREFRHMRNVGWRIDNIAEPGTPAVYRMTSVDNRLGVRLDPRQQAALRRAVLMADRADLAVRLGLAGQDAPAEIAAALPTADAGSSLGVVIRAIRHRALLRYRYSGSPRTVHPVALEARGGTWYLRARQEGEAAGGDRVKSFVVDRMIDVEAGEAGSADPVESVHRTGLNPLSWQVDPPVEVTLRTPVRFAPDVRHWLGEETSSSPAGDELDLVYVVTHRAALRQRLVELGTRVRVVGPADVRDELIAELAEMVVE